MSVGMSAAGKYGWHTDKGGYRYIDKQPSGADWPPIPMSVLDVWQTLVSPERAPDSCLINYYKEKARMGLQQDKDARYLSAIEVIVGLEQVRSGDFAVACPITLMKVGNTRMKRFMDRHPLGSLVLAGSTALAFLGGIAGWVMWAVG